jgi:hypothetical protein
VVIPNTGSVIAIGVGVYWDSGCTNQVTSIDWGMIGVGASEDKPLFIRNEGNVPMTLSLETQNWNPANASDYIDLSWDYGSGSIDVGVAVPVTLTLSVLDTIEGITSFSFDIVIIGSE